MEDIINKMTAAGILVNRGEERREGPARDSTPMSVVDEAATPEKKKPRKLN
jgi:hypothetical protein